MEHGQVIPASVWGRLKTVFHVAMVLVLITVDNSPAWVDVLVWVTTAITVVSGADYFFGLRSIAEARRTAARQATPSSHSRIET